jgi:REP element-mobilizing transposase RayT
VDARVSHARRQVDRRHPLHVTLRMKAHVWQLRSRRCFGIIERAFYRASGRDRVRLCHFSVQHNHVHLVVEADDPVALARGVQALAIRVVKGLNKLMGRKGAVFSDRYHARTLRTPTEVRNVLVYVLNNARKHLVGLGIRLGPDWLDPYSSADWFTGWTTVGPPRYGPAPISPPATWFLQSGYLRAGGLIRPDENPKT